MFNKIYRWFVKYDLEIGWFLTGWFTSEFFVDAGRGNWVGAAIDAVIVIINVSLYRGKRFD